MKKIEPLDLKLGADIQKLLDVEKWACKQRAKALMIPASFFNQESKQWSFTKYLYGHNSKGMWWFRLFGYGIHAKDLRIHGLMFSERNGHRKRLVLGNWSLRFLMRGGI